MRAARNLRVLTLVLAVSPLAAGQAPDKGVGLPTDWSHRQIAFHGSAAVGTQVLSRDPRALSNLAARAASAPAGSAAAPAKGKKPKPGLKGDWSVSLGGGSVAAAMSPAKFNFYTNSTITASNCTTDFVVYALNVPGVNAVGTATISSISRASNVVTVTTAAAHGFTNGLHVRINGVTNSGFNGNFVIASVPTATTFTYAQTASNASSSGGGASINQANLVALNNLYSGSAPAGNNGLCGFGAGTITNATRSSNVVTITTGAAHNLVTGNAVTITGVTDTSFNGTFVVTSVPTTTTFTYAQTAPNLTSSGGTAAVAATTYFAYNTSSALCSGAPCPTGGNFTSPSISFDATGRKIAFVESVSDASAVCPGRPGTGACSIFHVLTWAANEGSTDAPAVPGQNGSTAAMASITYASAANTTSSAWIDYNNDAAYVGADDGKLYRFLNVFGGTPTLDTSFGDVPGTAGVTITANQKLGPPVDLVGVGLNTGYIFIGDAAGNVKALGVANRSIIGSILVGGGLVTPGSLDPVLVYYDPVSNPNYISVFAVSASDSSFNAFPSGAPAINPNRGVVIQGLLDVTGPSFTAVSGIDTGRGTQGGQSVEYHAGTLDNTFYTTPTSGFLYVCGTGTNNQTPFLYRIGFNNGLAAPRNLVPTLNSAAVTSTSIQAFVTNASCSPITEFANPNLATTDTIFFGIGGTAARAYNWNITGTLQAAPIATASEPGGTSGIVVDNQQLVSGNGTSQGSSVYFTTLSPGTQCGTNTYCAVKLRQTDLQ